MGLMPATGQQTSTTGQQTDFGTQINIPKRVEDNGDRGIQNAHVIYVRKFTCAYVLGLFH